MHADHRDRVERVVGLAIAAAVESMAGRPAAGGLDGRGAAERGESAFAAQSLGVIASKREQLGGGLAPDTVLGEQSRGVRLYDRRCRSPSASRHRTATRSSRVPAKAVELARGAPGCHDFAVSADSADPERINVYERWRDRAALQAFRGDGPDDDLNALIVSADVGEFEVRPAQSGASLGTVA